MMNKIQKKWILFAGIFLAAGLCAAYGWYMIFAQEHPQPGAFSVQVVLTLVIGSLLLLVTGYLLIFRRWSIGKIYPLTALLLGVLYMIALPVYSKPDEMAHFDTAYELSNAWLGQEELPWEELFAKRIGDTVYQDTTLLVETYDTYWDTFSGNSDETLTAVENHSTGTVLAAVVPTVGITAARLMHLNFGWAAMLGTLCQIIFFVLAVTYAFRKLPFGERILFVVALLPMTMQQAASFSYDCELIAAAIVVTALALHWKYGSETVKKTEILVYAIATLLLLTTKSAVYVLVAFLPLFFLFRRTLLQQRRIRRVCVEIVVFVATAAVIFLLLGGWQKIYHVMVTWHIVPWSGDLAMSPAMLFSEPQLLPIRIVRTIAENGVYYVLTTVGGLLGNIDIVISNKVVFPILLLALLSIFQTQQERERIGVIGKKERVCSVLLAVIPDLLSVAAMLIFWTPWYMEVIQGVQGRYFLPTLPLLMIGVGFWKRPVIKVDTDVWNRCFAIAMTALSYLTVICIYIAVAKR